jgi:hypothetical protein
MRNTVTIHSRGAKPPVRASSYARLSKTWKKQIIDERAPEKLPLSALLLRGLTGGVDGDPVEDILRAVESELEVWQRAACNSHGGSFIDLDATDIERMLRRVGVARELASRRAADEGVSA